MGNKTKEKLKKFLDKTIDFFTEKETVYVQDENGEYTVVRTEEYDKLDETIKEFINDIKNAAEELEEEQKKQIEEAIELLGKMDFTQIDSSAITNILKEAQKEIEDSKSIHIDRPSQIGRGGYMGVVHRTENGKELGNPTRPTGGFMLPRDEELADEFGGDYTKTDKTIEIFKKAFEKINEIIEKTEEKSNEELRDEIIKGLTKNKESIIDKIEDNSISKPEGTKIKEVHRNKGLQRITAILLTATLATGTFVAGFNMKSENLSIPVSDVEITEIDPKEDSDDIIFDVNGDIETLNGQNNGVANEANATEKTKEDLEKKRSI